MRIRDARLRFTGAWLLLAIGTFLSTVAYAGQGVWTSGGPFGGLVSALAIDPLNPAKLYAAQQSEAFQRTGVLFKSTDAGESWVAANPGLRGPDVRALAINPVTPSMLYAATELGVLKSTDSGDTWVAANTGLPNVYLSALAINPTTPSTVYVGTYGGGVFRSTDSGGTWAAVNTGLTDVTISALAINPSIPSTICAGSYGGGVFRSTDSGGTWEAVNTGLTNLEVQALAINPTTPSTLYAGTNGGGIFRSTDSGGTWSAVNGGLTNLIIVDLAINPLAPSMIYGGTSGGGVFKSTDSGGSWAAVNTGLTSAGVSTLVINPSTPSTLYSATFGGGVFKSTDSGATWAAKGLPNRSVTALAIDPSTPSTLYAGTSLGTVGVFKSTDSGATWAPANTGLPYPWVSALAIDPVTPSTLYAVTRFYVLGPWGALSKSTDSGGTWVPAGVGLEGVAVGLLAIDPATPSTLYAGTNAGVFKSKDSGDTWTATNTGLTKLDVRALVIDPVTPSTVYAVSGFSSQGMIGPYEVFKSTDSGATWASANAGLTNQWVIALAIDPVTPSTLYAGTNGGGIFKSTNAGGTWAAANTGLTTGTVFALTINPATPNELYAGGSGLYKSTNSGGTWFAVNAGLPPRIVSALALDPTGATTLFAGLDGGGVWQSTPATGAPASFFEFVPIVLDVVGLAHYTSELQLTNLGTGPATLMLTYIGSIGAGAGDVMETVPAGQQVVYPDAISYLRTKGVSIPASGNQGGTLLISAPYAGVHATVRTGADTVAPQPIGRAGLAYTGTAAAASSSAAKVVYGLRSSDADRSNLAVYNMGKDPISLRVTLVSGDGSFFDVTAGVPRVLPPYGWYQYSGVLNDAGYSSGYAIVERVSGSGPFGAYGVVNDQITNDGSFIPALSVALSGSKLTIPVLVETSAFESELILANRGQSAGQSRTTFTLRYVESISPSKGAGGTTTVEVAAGQQKVIPNAIDFLRSQGVSIGARGEASYAGSLQVQGGGAFGEIIFVGAQTSSLSPAGGKFGVFYPAIDPSQEFSEVAYVLGLKADARNRSNVAAIHTGADGSGPITLEFQVLDGSEGGRAVGQPLSLSLNPGQWVQPARFFASGGVPNGYVRIRRTAGSAPWYAYGVINDGGEPGQRTGDGSYVPGVRP